MYKYILSLLFLVLHIGCTSKNPAQIVDLGEKFYGYKEFNNYANYNKILQNKSKPKIDITPESQELLYSKQHISERIIEHSSTKINQNIPTQINNNTVKIVSLQNEGVSSTKTPFVPETAVNTKDDISIKNSKGYIWPVQGKIISTFGVKGGGIKNDGINIASAEGTKIKAISSGQVLYAGNELRGYGNLLIIKQPDGTLVAYAHQKSIIVKKGDIIKQGQVIGYVGMTGSVATPQLHLAIRKNKKSVNPLDYLQ
ncbi:MAG: murein hydrolase activator EnvC [Rickettsiales endosymbiont of Dermacentor nuttalli]